MQGSGIYRADLACLVIENRERRAQRHEVNTAIEAEPKVAVAVFVQRQHRIVLQAVLAVEMKAQLAVCFENKKTK